MSWTGGRKSRSPARNICMRIEDSAIEREIIETRAKIKKKKRKGRVHLYKDIIIDMERDVERAHVRDYYIINNSRQRTHV